MAFVMTTAIAHLHSHGVLHRDIALRNFVLSSNGLPILIDFGLARQVRVFTVTKAIDIFKYLRVTYRALSGIYGIYRAPSTCIGVLYQ